MENIQAPKITAILDLYESQKAIRARGDKLRWDAMAFIGHRKKEYTISDDCPVPDIHLYDSSGILAVRTLVESLGGSVMSPNQDWFSMRIVSKDFRIILPPAYANDYTSYATRAMSDEMNHSNFYDENSLAFYDSISCGYSCTLYQNDPKEKRIYLQTLEPWNCWFDVDKTGRFTHFFYKYTLDGYALIDRFGDSLGKELREEAAVQGKSRSYNVLFCIIERPKLYDSRGKEVSFSSRIGRNMRYAAVSVLLDRNIILDESGYTDFPVVIHIWEKSGDSHYGVGLVMKYITEFSKLNRLGLEYGLVAAKLNHGAWLVPDTLLDSFSDDPETIIGYQSSDLLPRPLQENLDLNAIGEQLALQQQYITKLFYNDIFSYLLSQDKVFTATQVNAVKAEGMSKIYSIYTSIQSRKIDPSLKLVYKIMVDNKRLAKPPRNVIGRGTSNRMEFILDSAMSQMLQRYQTQTANSVLLDLYIQLQNLGMGSLAQKYMDIGNLILSYMEQTGAPANLYVSESKRNEMEDSERNITQEQLDLQTRLTESEINRNNAGASNLNNAVGANGGFQ